MNEPILTISVAARLLKLHPRSLMLYERMGFLSPHRTGTNRRMFSFQDLEEIQFVQYLTQQIGINLQGVKTLLEAIKIGQKNNIDIKMQLFPEFKVKALV